MKQIRLEETTHYGKNRIKLIFPYDNSIISKVKKIHYIRWSKTMNCWHIPVREEYVNYLYDVVKGVQFCDKNGLLINPSTVTFEEKEGTIDVSHNNAQNLLFLKVPYKYKHIVIKLSGIRWHSESKLWVASATKENVNQLIDEFAKINFAVKIKQSNFTLFALKENRFDMLGELTLHQDAEIHRFKKWLIQKRFSENTIKVYIGSITVFFRYFGSKPIDEISPSDIENFNNDFIIRNGYSSKTQNQYLSAIKSYYIKMRGVKHELNSIERPIEGMKLPKVIAIEDVKLIFSKISNIKHLIALTTIYSLGLRRSELLNLTLDDLSFKRNVVKIVNSKGRKDRDLPLPVKLKNLMIKYINQKEPVKWFIEGSVVGEQYSASSLSNIFHRYADKVIPKNSFTLHSLRHSYATHLLDMGVDLRNIQELLGHKSSRTTEIYTHVTMRNLKNIRNPLDDFDL